MKYKKKCFLLILFLFIGCNQDKITESNETKLIQGRWIEKYHYEYDPFEFVVPTNVTIDDTVKNATTIIEMKDNKVIIMTFPQQRNPYLFNSAIYLSDTLYDGFYYIKEDSLFFKIKGSNFQGNILLKIEDYTLFKFTYKLNNNILDIIDTIPRSEDPYAVPLYYSSFLWGYSYNKQEGSFIKYK